MELTENAQALLHAMDEAAQSHAMQRGRGHSIIHEDKVGGLGPNRPEAGDYFPDDTGAAEYEAAVKAWEQHPIRSAIVELNAAGLDIRVSAGETDRYIQAAGRMFSKAA